jgi:hypothetical protein
VQTTTTKRQPTRRTPAAVAKLPYPKMTGTEDRLFWLSVFFRNLTELQAIDQLVTELHRRGRPDVVLHALYGAMSVMRVDLKKSQDYVLKEGLLPFAFTGTTVFATEQVVA